MQPLPSATDGAGPELSCVGQTCVVAVATSVATIADTFTDGHWTGPKVADSNGLLGAISCPTTSFCAALGEPDFNVRGNPAGLCVETWQHGTWTGPVYLPGGVSRFNATGDLGDALSCTSATFCLADLTSGPVWRYNGRTWSAIASPPTASPGITGVTCARPTFCVATVTPSTNSKHQPT